MTNQTAISVKLNNNILEDLNLLSKELDCKRNRLINFACRVLCDNMLNETTKAHLTFIYGQAFQGIEDL